eukprot:m.294843 g.294843  ORF g.294843 m.294843 type:complete len:394 (-) comp27167_c2_seq5:3083-4264(-)
MRSSSRSSRAVCRSPPKMYRVSSTWHDAVAHADVGASVGREPASVPVSSTSAFRPYRHRHRPVTAVPPVRTFLSRAAATPLAQLGPIHFDSGRESAVPSLSLASAMLPRHIWAAPRIHMASGDRRHPPAKWAITAHERCIPVSSTLLFSLSIVSNSPAWNLKTVRTVLAAVLLMRTSSSSFRSVGSGDRTLCSLIILMISFSTGLKITLSRFIRMVRRSACAATPGVEEAGGRVGSSRFAGLSATQTVRPSRAVMEAVYLPDAVSDPTTAGQPLSSYRETSATTTALAPYGIPPSAAVCLSSAKIVASALAASAMTFSSLTLSAVALGSHAAAAATASPRLSFLPSLPGIHMASEHTRRERLCACACVPVSVHLLSGDCGRDSEKCSRLPKSS